MHVFHFCDFVLLLQSSVFALIKRATASRVRQMPTLQAQPSALFRNPAVYINRAYSSKLRKLVRVHRQGCADEMKSCR